jgi:hypothetical protein
MNADPIILVIPHGKRSIRLRVPRDTAAWLRDELTRAVGDRPKPRRRVRLRCGRWINGRAAP